jgi:hypothetical protein
MDEVALEQDIRWRAVAARDRRKPQAASGSCCGKRRDLRQKLRNNSKSFGLLEISETDPKVFDGN